MVKGLFVDSLRLFDPQCDEYYDMTHFEFLNDKIGNLFLPDHTDPDDSYVDLVIKINRKEHPGKRNILHIAIQETADEAFSEHLFQYYYRIGHIYNVPVQSIAVITGDNPTGLRQYTYSDITGGTKLTYKYWTYGINEQSEEAVK